MLLSDVLLVMSSLISCHCQTNLNVPYYERQSQSQQILEPWNAGGGNSIFKELNIFTIYNTSLLRTFKNMQTDNSELLKVCCKTVCIDTTNMEPVQVLGLSSLSMDPPGELAQILAQIVYKNFRSLEKF